MWARLCAHTLPYEVTEKNVNNVLFCTYFYPQIINSPVFTYIFKKVCTISAPEGHKKTPHVET